GADVPRRPPTLEDHRGGEQDARDEEEWEEVEVDWDENTGSGGLLDEIVAESRPHSVEERQHARDLIGEFVKQVLVGGIRPEYGGVRSSIRATVAKIDSTISGQMNQILHHPEFQRLHATWLGIRDAVLRAGSGRGVEIRVFNATKRDLFKDKRSVDSLADSE